MTSRDPADQILAPGEPGDLRWRVSYRKYHVSPVIHSVCDLRWSSWPHYNHM